MGRGKLNPLALAYAAAIVSAAVMLLLGVGPNVGIYASAAEQMRKWHLFLSPSIGGIVAGMLEGAIIGFILAYTSGWLYNRFV